MAPKDEKPANQEQQEKLDSSKPKKVDNLTPEESATAYLKKTNWLLGKFETDKKIVEAKRKIEEKEKAHIETASQLADYYKHPERQNSKTYSRLLEEYSLSLVELVESAENMVGGKEKIKLHIVTFDKQQKPSGQPTFDISIITGEPPRHQKQKEQTGLIPQQQEITVPSTPDEYQALKQKLTGNLLLARYNIYLETGDKKYKKYFDEYHKNAPQDETSKKLEHIQQLRVTDPMEAYRQCAKLAKDFPQAKELAADILTRNPIFTEFNNDLAALMRDTQPFRQSIDALLQEVQKNGEPSRELIERWVYPAAKEAQNNSRIAKIMNSPAYQLFLNLKGQYGGKQNAPSIETMIGGADASFQALGPEVQTAFARMQENILQGFKYCQEVKKTAEIALDIKGERAGVGGFTVDALIVAGKTLLAVAGAVAVVNCFPGAGVVAVTVLGGFGAAFGSAVGEATFENDYSGFMPKNFAMNWAMGAAFSGAGRIAGAALGSVGGKAAAALAKSNASWSRSAEAYAEKYIQRMAQHPISGTAGGFKHLIAEIASETREEFMEDALQRIGQGVAPDHPWLGFAFSLIPSATTTAKGTFAKSAGKFSPQTGIEGEITNSGIELTYNPNETDAARTLLQQRGAPPEVLQQFDSTGQVDVTQEGVSVTVKPETQGDLEPEIEAVVRARYEHYETLTQQISSLPAEYRNRAQAIIDKRIAGTKETLSAYRPIKKDNLTFASLIEVHGKIAKMEESLAKLPKDIEADFRKSLNDERDEFLKLYEGDFASKQSQQTTNLIRNMELIESRRQYALEHSETARFAIEKLGRIPSVKILEQLEPLRAKLVSFREIFAELESMESLLLAYPELQIDRGRLTAIEELRKIDAGEISGDSLLSESGDSISPKIETLMSRAEDPESLKSRLDLLRKFDQEIGQKVSQNQKSEITRFYQEMVIGGNITHETFKERVASYERSYKNLSDLPALNPEGREQYSANVALTLENFLVEKIIQKGMDAELIAKSIKAKYEETAETAGVTININYGPLAQVMKEGKFRTYEGLDVQHREKGLFGKTGYGQRRSARDEAMGYEGKFVVGALSSRNGYDEIIGPAPFYGHGAVKLKSERVKGRVKFFEGDSLTSKKNAETVNPNWLVRKWDNLQSRTLDNQGAILSKALMELELTEAGATHAHTMYVEAHIIGDVTLNDIADITYGIVGRGQEKMELKAAGNDASPTRQASAEFDLARLEREETRKREVLGIIKTEAEARGIHFETIELKAEIKPVEDPHMEGNFRRQLMMDKEVNTGTSEFKAETTPVLDSRYREVYEENGRNIVLFNALRAEIEAGKISPDALRAISKIFYPNENDWKLPEGLDPKQANELLAQKIAEVGGLSITRARQLIPGVMGGVGNNAEWWNGVFRKGEAAQIYTDPEMSLDTKELLYELYPKGIENSHLRQQNVGDCFFLSTWNASKQNPLAPYLVAKMIRKVGNNWEVRFLGGNTTITITPEEVNGQMVKNEHGQWEYKKSVEGELGDRILERAFGRQRRLNRGDINEDAEMPIDAPTMMVLDKGGHASSAIDLLLNGFAELTSYRPPHSSNLVPVSASIGLALTEVSSNPNKYLVYASTPQVVTPPLLKRHAYSVFSINPTERTLIVVDPHDTKYKRHTLTFEEFTQKFRSLSITKIHTDLLRQELGIPKLSPRKPAGLNILPKNIRTPHKISNTEALRIQAGSNPQNSIKCSIENGVLVLQTPKGNYELKPGDRPMIFGRKHNNLNDDLTVSGDHFQIEFGRDGQIYVTDLGSKNGTTIEKTAKEIVRPAPAPAPSPEIGNFMIAPGIRRGRMVSDTNYQYINFNEIHLSMGNGPESVPVHIEVIRNKPPNPSFVRVSCQDFEWHLLPGDKPLTIGRENSNLPQLPDTVSKKHLNISYSPDGALLVRDASTNGTYVQSIN